jgi:hypothetical protein
VVWSIATALLLIGAVGWLLQWRRGQRTILDEQRRLKPEVAAALLLAALILVGAVGSVLG